MNGLALCSGVGGIDLGLKLATGGAYRSVCHVEREGFVAAVLVARMAEKVLEDAPIWDDVTTFDGRPWRGIVDVITAGFPCQPHSVAGKRQGMADSRWIWDDIARIVDEVRPSLVFIENVPGLVTSGLERVRADLLRMGFRVEAGFFSATEVGAPHRRQRLFILAHAECGGVRKQVRGESTSVGIPECTRRPPSWTGSEVNGGLEPFPPGPQGGFPDGLEPAIRRVADGDASRMDRLRALGNGVVPLVVANAWTTLQGRIA